MRWIARTRASDAETARLAAVRAIRPGRRAAAALLALATAALAAALPAPAAASSGPEYFGTNLQTIGVVPSNRWSAFLAPLQQGAMAIDRMEVRWYDVEPDPPQGAVHTYDWGSTDFLLGTMAARGLRAAPLFRFSPTWAQTPDRSKKYGTDELPPSSYDDYAAMIAAFAKRYGPGGRFWQLHPEYAAKPTLSYEVWNEANLDQYAWNQQADAQVYSDVLRVVRPTVRAVQPDAAIVGSLAWQTSGDGVVPDFVEKLRAAGGLAQLDAIGYHPYAPDAQSILTLVTGLRAQLAAAGYPDLPIYANETGQPAVLDGPGAQFAYAGRPSDAARASSVAFAGEALAASDCGVDQFLLYTIVGTETELEPIGEGFMGMLRKADGTPNATGQALQRASLRWAGRFASGHLDLPGRLALCSGGPSPEAALLRIGATFVGGTPGCLAVQTTYDGNPLESAVLRLFDPNDGSQLAESRTDAFGNAGACVPLTLRGQPYTAYADIAGAGRTAVVRCDVPGVGCQPGTIRTDVPASAQLPQRTPTPAAACAWGLTATAQRPRAGRRGKPATTKLRMTATCATAPAGSKVAVTVLLARGKKGASKKIRTIWLEANRPRTVVVSRTVTKGDRLIVRQRPNPALAVPPTRRQVTLGRVVQD